VNAHMTDSDRKPVMAVIIPCFNEAATIAQVIADFRRELPFATIHVFDNNSSDDTAAIARSAGALVSHEYRQGKGNVVKTMFQEVDADIYVLVDGDTTYPADKVHDLLKPVLEGMADMVVGSRLLDKSSEMHQVNLFGNRLFLFVVNMIFGSCLTDILSGYRVMTREFVRAIPVLSQGFQVETELSIQALHKDMRVWEVPVKLVNRPPGGESKIRIASDGLKIIYTILDLFRTYKPLTVFGLAGVILIVVGSAIALPVVVEYFQTGLVPRLPSAILAAGLWLTGLLSISVGLILNTLARNFKELTYQILNLDRQLRAHPIDRNLMISRESK
jgi:glycosyltransferase involved in cell wall biosynthesis